MLYVYVDVAALNEEVLVLRVSFQGFVQVIEGFLVVFHQSVSLTDALEDACILGSKLLGIEEVLYRLLVASLSQFSKFYL